MMFEIFCSKHCWTIKKTIQYSYRQNKTVRGKCNAHHVKNVIFCLQTTGTPCDPSSPYQTLTGRCNNVKNPVWGATNSPFIRLVPPQYGPDNTPRGTGTTTRPGAQVQQQTYGGMYDDILS